jgi:protein TonB
MFEQTFVNSQARTRKPWTVGASLAIQSLAVVAGIIVPLLHVASLETPVRDLPLFVTLRPLAERHPPAYAAAVAPTTARVLHNHFAAPSHIPNHIDMAPDAPESPAIVLPDSPVAFSGSSAVPGFSFATMPAPPQPARPKSAPPAAPQAPLRVGTGVQAANLVFGPKPVYPLLAKSARVQGTIKLQAIIAVNGTIKNLKLISGPPLLVNAAMEAVRRWQYKPTLLNGSPVEVITEIDVNFTLN